MTRCIFFLDVDGVLNHYDAFAAQRERIKAGLTTVSALFTIDDACLQRFMSLVEETGATVVLSSTWRLFDNSREHLTSVGVTWSAMTPELGDPRRQEILATLADLDPERTRPVVVFDDGKSADLNEPNALFVHTNMHEGLTDAHVTMVRDWLGSR